MTRQQQIHRNDGRCCCHSDLIYASLMKCPACGHWTLDRAGNWEGCERRACGYEHVKTDEEAPDAD